MLLLEIYEEPTETIVKVIAARLLTDCIVLLVFRVVSGRRSEFSCIHSLVLIHRVSWWIDTSVLWLAPSLASFYYVMLDGAWVSNIDWMFVTHWVTCMSSVLHYKLPLTNHLILLVDFTTKWLWHSINWVVHVSMTMARNSFCTFNVNTWCSTITFLDLVLSVLYLSLALHGRPILWIVHNSFFLDDCTAGRLVWGDHWRGLLLSWH